MFIKIFIKNLIDLFTTYVTSVFSTAELHFSGWKFCLSFLVENGFLWIFFYCQFFPLTKFTYCFRVIMTNISRKLKKKIYKTEQRFLKWKTKTMFSKQSQAKFSPLNFVDNSGTQNCSVSMLLKSIETIFQHHISIVLS